MGEGVCRDMRRNLKGWQTKVRTLRRWDKAKGRKGVACTAGRSKKHGSRRVCTLRRGLCVIIIL